MHNVPLEFWSAALLGAASTGEKIIASDKKSSLAAGRRRWCWKRGDSGGIFC
jgi:hypothetical protein